MQSLFHTAHAFIGHRHASSVRRFSLYLFVGFYDLHVYPAFQAGDDAAAPGALVVELLARRVLWDRVGRR